jgi:hypothetical protein
MTPDVALEIAELALSIAKSQTPGKIQEGTALAEILLKIIGKAVHANQDHTGEALDPSLIKVEEPLLKFRDPSLTKPNAD